MSDFLKDDNNNTGKIDFSTLASMGCIYTQGNGKQKTDVMDCIAHEGPERTQIDANDDAFFEYFKTNCRIATWFAFESVKNLQSIAHSFNIIESDINRVIDDKYNGLFADLIKAIYPAGVTTLHIEAWKESIRNNAFWIFDAPELRKRILEKCGCIYQE